MHNVFLHFFSKACQSANWDNHKIKCKEAKKSFKAVKMDSDKKLFSGSNQPLAKNIFIVKAQFLGKTKSIFARPKGNLVLYNQDGSLQSSVSKECPNFEQLEKMVLEKGFWGVNAYCNAKWSKEKGLMIDMEHVLPYQDW